MRNYEFQVEVNFMDDVGQTLLNWASAFGTQEMVEFLCAKGADVNKGKNRYFPKGIFIFPKGQFSQWHFPNFNILNRSFLISWFLPFLLFDISLTVPLSKFKWIYFILQVNEVAVCTTLLALEDLELERFFSDTEPTLISG